MDPSSRVEEGSTDVDAAARGAPRRDTASVAAVPPGRALHPVPGPARTRGRGGTGLGHLRRRPRAATGLRGFAIRTRRAALAPAVLEPATAAASTRRRAPDVRRPPARARPAAGGLRVVRATAPTAAPAPVVAGSGLADRPVRVPRRARGRLRGRVLLR